MNSLTVDLMTQQTAITRLAERLAAVSRGIDQGFGITTLEPMWEKVHQAIDQCRVSGVSRTAVAQTIIDSPRPGGKRVSVQYRLAL